VEADMAVEISLKEADVSAVGVDVLLLKHAPTFYKCIFHQMNSKLAG
jgi:hypothetical protein